MEFVGVKKPEIRILIPKCYVEWGYLLFNPVEGLSGFLSTNDAALCHRRGGEGAAVQWMGSTDEEEEEMTFVSFRLFN